MSEGKKTGKILFVMTGADEWTLADGSKHKTGFWAEEAADRSRSSVRPVSR